MGETEGLPISDKGTAAEGVGESEKVGESRRKCCAGDCGDNESSIYSVKMKLITLVSLCAPYRADMAKRCDRFSLIHPAVSYYIDMASFHIITKKVTALSK